MAAEDDERDFRQEIADESLPPEIEAGAVPIRLDALFPWHRPRKQKVRQDQWVGLATTLVQKLQSQSVLVPRQVTLPDGSSQIVAPEFRYLTLPGLDYLDVRMIGEMCNGRNVRLTSVGFLSDAVEAPIMARARVREVGLIQAGFISDTSITLPRGLETVCGSDGGTMKELRRRAPFHVVNIDACGSIAPRRAAHSGRLIDAIHKLVELQLSKANHRWLLFVTVDAREGDMDPATFDQLCDAIRENAAGDPEFRDGVLEFLAPGAPDVDTAIGAARTGGARPFLDVFALGLSKWLLHLAQIKQWSVRLKPSHCYSTRPADDPEPSMCSLALEFIPPPTALPDPFGVSRQAPAPGGSPVNASLQILAGAIGMDDLDAVLEADPEESGRLNEATRRLLAEVGYEESALRPLLGAEGGAGRPALFPDLSGQTGTRPR